MAAPPARSRALRVVSLLPSATENVAALLEFCASASQAATAPKLQPPVLVGRSHECDYPVTSAVQDLPVLTAPRTAFTSSSDTHKQVRQALADASSLYHLDADKLVELRPDVVFTQSTCKVCSIDLATVETTLDGRSITDTAGTCPVVAPPPFLSLQYEGGDDSRPITKIVTCNPITLEQALVDQFQQMGRALNIEAQGDAMATQHQRELKLLQDRAKTLADTRKETRKARVMLVEWLDPLFLGTKGWMRDIIESAGAEVVETAESTESVDVVIVALCGLSLSKTEDEVRSGRVGSWWNDVVASKSKKDQPVITLVDGTSMFTRPTKRLLLALEWLVNIVHDPTGDWRATSEFPFKQYEIPESTSSKDDLEAKRKQKQDAALLEIEELHRLACERKELMYTDPATGYSVLTADFLKKKQVCCGNGCRHCPYGHVNVKDSARRKNLLAQNVFLKPQGRKKTAVGGEILWPTDVEYGRRSEGPRDLVVMFWSGGKDSFLALSQLYANYATRSDNPPMPEVVLMTSIDPETNVVPVQNISMPVIAAQAKALGLPLCFVAVGLGGTYSSKLRAALEELPSNFAQRKISTLVFGDLHLEDIRAWRESAFGADYSLAFPVWKKDYEEELLPTLEKICTQIQARIVYSAVDSFRLQEKGWKPGHPYQWKDVSALNSATNSQDPDAASELAKIDIMGECGEFHTCVLFPGMDI